MLDIQTGNVTVDLNGHTLSVSGSTDPAISIGGAGTLGVEPVPFRIANGTIEGGMYGIHVMDAQRRQVRLERLTVKDASEAAVRMDDVADLAARGIVIVDSKVGFELMGTPSDAVHPAARIADSSIRADRGIRCSGVTCSIVHDTVASCVTPVILNGADGSEAAGSTFVHPGAICGFNPQPEPPGHGVDVQSSTGVSIRENTLIGAGVQNGANHGIGFDAASDGGTIADNVVRGFGDDGIRVMAAACDIRNNLASGNGGAGIHLGGSNDVASGNTLLGNGGVGLYFESGPAVPHVYRDNILTGNAAGVGGPGLADAVDGGGNVE